MRLVERFERRLPDRALAGALNAMLIVSVPASAGAVMPSDASATAAAVASRAAVRRGDGSYVSPVLGVVVRDRRVVTPVAVAERLRYGHVLRPDLRRAEHERTAVPRRSCAARRHS